MTELEIPIRIEADTHETYPIYRIFTVEVTYNGKPMKRARANIEIVLGTGRLEGDSPEQQAITETANKDGQVLIS